MNRNSRMTKLFPKLWITASITLMTMFPMNIACAQTKQQAPQQSIKTIYPTKDWVISDFVVTEFGAKAEPGFDNRVAFQAAIDAAYKSGGGVVYIPAGNYVAHKLVLKMSGFAKAARKQRQISISSMFYVSILVYSYGEIGLIRNLIMEKSLERFSKCVSVKIHRIMMEALKVGGTMAKREMHFAQPIQA